MSRPSVWRWPILLGLASLVGLLSALVGDGFWDALSWAALGLPIAVAMHHGAGPQPGPRTLRLRSRAGRAPQTP